MLVIAHRGANKEALENSWSAYERAVDIGAQRIELDVHLSADGEVVINHDDSLIHTTGKDLYFSKLTAAEIRKLKLLNGEPIPFLAEVIERLLPNIELNIEIKGKSTDLANAVAKLVRNHPKREKIIISCFYAAPLVWLKDHCPETQRACLWSSDSFEWPFFSTLAPPVFMEKTGSKILHPLSTLVTENLMDQARARGWRVYPWTTMVGEDHDRESQWTILKTLGIDGLCTNYPRELKKWLLEVESYGAKYRG